MQPGSPYRPGVDHRQFNAGERGGDGLSQWQKYLGQEWLQQNYPDTSWYLVNHPSRKLRYSVADFRDFNNAAPDVAFGMEGLPGHQKEPGRGGYDNGPFFDANGNDITYRARTYGGADYMTAKVGGLWDALLGEGRRFWIFVNSDFHNDQGGDFWPGEYAKSYTYAQGSGYDALVDGMRSGNSYAVQGDLIDELDFTTSTKATSATMGQTLKVKKGSDIRVKIRFRVPATNNNGDKPKVDHVDLIKGEFGPKAAPGTPAYTDETNPTTGVEARFSSRSWTARDSSRSWYTVTYVLKNVEKDTYLRLRGTNLGLNVPDQTDAEGNPLNDDLVGPNDGAKAYADLWFYSNPIFIDVN